MASPPPNPDTRELPFGWIQQYNWEYRQWFYVNTREQPARSSWEHPLGPLSQNFGAPPGPPPDRAYSRSPYGDRPAAQGYGPGYYGPSSQGYYNNPSGGYAGAPPYGAGYPENRGYYPPQQTVYVEEDRRQRKKGPGLGTAVLAGGAGLVGGALLMDAIEDHDSYEREIGFDQGYQDGFDNGIGDGFGW